MAYPPTLEKVKLFYKKLPGIGEKSAERMALATLNLDDDIISEFAENVVQMKTKLHLCKICHNLTEDEVCSICADKNRNQNLICVVEDYKSLASFENAGNFEGVYHVLDKLISPINNIGPSEINLASLIKRVENLENPEIILALKSSIEGETTTLYIKKIFEGKNVVISRLSYGIPMGAEFEYLDILTLDKALEDRKKIS